MEIVIAAVLNALSYLGVALIGFFGGRRLVGPNQDKLINTLQDIVDAQDIKMKSLEEENTARDEKIAQLDKQLIELKALTIFQAKEIERLTRQLNARG